MSEVVKSLLPTLATMTDAEKAELRALLPVPASDVPVPSEDELDEAWADELDRRKNRAEETGHWGRPVDEVMAELKAKYG